MRWLGITIPEEVEKRVLGKAEVSKEDAVNESIEICVQTLRNILAQTSGCGVPLGISVESVSGFKEEIEGAFTLFRLLQSAMLDSIGSPWAVCWYRVPVNSYLQAEELVRQQQKQHGQQSVQASSEILQAS